MPAWLNDAVFYEIYPQSFCDTNGDGIGDFQGIISRLDYIKSLGCNALWINPCFDSPFKDAGYDVRNYKLAAPRYGTNEDLKQLFETAHQKGIKVLLDLVPGHTSEEHAWFLESQKNEENAYTGRYIWTSFCFEGARSVGYPYVGGETQRSGTYLLNFFKCQPALNYGWLEADENWKDAADSANARGTIEAMKDVMRFWMDLGCDGFRVDMAASLVKGDDEKKTGTSRIWQEVRAMFDSDYPENVLVAEWSRPNLSLPAGFHADFLLNELGSAYSTLARDYQNHADRNILADPWFTGRKGAVRQVYEDHSYFRSDSGSDCSAFMEEYLKLYADTKAAGHISLITCNHDTVRPSYNLTDQELKLFYAFLFTLPGVPFLYYGDEIGMRYLSLPTHEGGYFRTGSRTPMQWDNTENLGFSRAEKEALYLPVDPKTDAPTVAMQEKDPDSLLNTVRELLSLRHEKHQLRGDAPIRLRYLEKGDPLLIYQRDDLIVAVNPSKRERKAPIQEKDREALFTIGSGLLADGVLKLAPQSFAVF